MKKLLAVLLLLTTAFATFSCKNNGEDNQQNGAEGENRLSVRIDEIVPACIYATVTNGAETNVEYRINTDDSTKYFLNGAQSDKSALSVGMSADIVHSGRVTRSLPPQIFALQIYAYTSAKSVSSPDVGATDAEVSVGEFQMMAKVTGTDGRLTVEVLESDYACGTYVVTVGDATEICNAQGDAASISDVSVSDTVLITYTGQVMLSLPAQIIAEKIIIFE